MKTANNVPPKGTTNALLRKMSMLALAASLSLASACAWFQSGPVVPEYPTAREQAENAMRQYTWASRTVDEQLKEEEYDKAIAALKTTIDKFPKDREYTPAAHALLAQSYMEMEEYRTAEKIYKDVVEKYPDIDDVHASALIGLARAQKSQNKFREEKDSLRQLIDTYEENPDPKIQQYVEIAKVFYGEIETGNKRTIGRNNRR